MGSIPTDVKKEWVDTIMRLFKERIEKLENDAFGDPNRVALTRARNAIGLDEDIVARFDAAKVALSEAQAAVTVKAAALARVTQEMEKRAGITNRYGHSCSPESGLPQHLQKAVDERMVYERNAMIEELGKESEVSRLRIRCSELISSMKLAGNLRQVRAIYELACKGVGAPTPVGLD